LNTPLGAPLGRIYDGAYEKECDLGLQFHTPNEHLVPLLGVGHMKSNVALEKV